MIGGVNGNWSFFEKKDFLSLSVLFPWKFSLKFSQSIDPPLVIHPRNRTHLLGFTKTVNTLFSCHFLLQTSRKVSELTNKSAMLKESSFFSSNLLIELTWLCKQTNPSLVPCTTSDEAYLQSMTKWLAERELELLQLHVREKSSRLKFSPSWNSEQWDWNSLNPKKHLIQAF